MSLEILDLAKDDWIDGFRFYEAQEPGLGSDFPDTLFSDIDSLGIFGGVHRKACKDLHRSLSKRFLFAIHCTVEEGTIRVRSVVDCRRNPSRN